MTVLDFPASPAIDQTYAAPNGVTYKWDGMSWVVIGGAGGGGVPGGPDLSVQFKFEDQFTGYANFHFDGTTLVAPILQGAAGKFGGLAGAQNVFEVASNNYMWNVPSLSSIYWNDTDKQWYFNSEGVNGVMRVNKDGVVVSNLAGAVTVYGAKVGSDANNYLMSVGAIHEWNHPGGASIYYDATNKAYSINPDGVNGVLVVTAAGVTIQNLTIQNTFAAANIYGTQVGQSANYLRTDGTVYEWNHPGNASIYYNGADQTYYHNPGGVNGVLRVAPSGVTISNLALTGNFNPANIGASGNIYGDQVGNSANNMLKSVGNVHQWNHPGGASIYFDAATNVYSFNPPSFNGAVQIKTSAFESHATPYAWQAAFTVLSDASQKEHVRDISLRRAIERIGSLRPRAFSWRDETEAQHTARMERKRPSLKARGFVAQEFETVYPELVRTSDAGLKGIGVDMDFYADLVASIKFLKQRVEDLEARLASNP